MSTRAHVLVALLTAGTLAFILRLVRSRQLRAKYAMLWISVGLALVVLAAFPGLIDRTSQALGIYYEPATFMLAAIAFLLVLVVHFSWELSRLEDRTRILAEELAITESRLSKLTAELTAANPPQ